MASKADQIELSLSLPSDADASAPVECLGLTFANDAERRAYFLDKLREKLQEPEFRQIEGFPIGADEDILALSDPPYYTACPNPFLEDFIRCYGKPYDPETDDYHREPFAADVSEGKSDPIFTAHSYHTKVPHKAIMRYILHYTEPGDVVLDGFAGSGMTGVAAQMCAHPDPDLKYAIESERQNAGLSLPEWGERKTVLNDLGVAATFIEANYNLPFDVQAFEREAKRILSELEEECGWMYETIHDGDTKGRINYTVWSQVFSCPECTGEINFVKEALDPETKRVKESFLCPHCGANLNKGNLERVMETSLDSDTKKIWQHVRFDPAIVNYSIGKQKHEKLVSMYDLEILQRISNIPLPEFVPTDAFPIKQMYHGSRLEPKRFTNTHHLFLPRAAQALGRLWSKVKAISDDRLRNMLLFFVEQAVWGMSVLARYTPTHFSQVNQYLNGVYYIASQHAECSPWYILDGKLKRLIGAFKESPIISNQAIVSTGTAAKLSCPDSSVDYIFTDPPFGENIYYADLNFLLERDGMIFLPEQASAYDRKRVQTASAPQIELFVYDEKTSIDWLYHLLKQRPSTYQDIQPEYLKQVSASWRKHESRLELLDLLERNFLRYDGKGEVPSQIHSYLSTNYKDLRNLTKEDPQLINKAKERWYVPNPDKASDLEKIRERELLKEFETYRQSKQKQIKEFRIEAMRAGFKKAWQDKDYRTIVNVAEKLPNDVVEEDEKLLMYYDMSQTRLGED